jgi:phosphonopyruvate decarboxylase
MNNMLDCEETFKELIRNDIHFFTGVPDSLLKYFLAYITDNTDNQKHIIAANEGNAIALAVGYYLGTGLPALVYMQNSGLGNAVNPLTSLADEEVYGIPMLLIIGWRGEPDKHDEPQHIKQGKITLDLLKTLGLEYSILPDNQKEANQYIKKSIQKINEQQKPYAIVIRKNTFQQYTLINPRHTDFEMTREEAIKVIFNHLDQNTAVISTTGKTSRELFELRHVDGRKQQGQDFYTVGSMGHASQIALGVALSRQRKNVVCLDGDGALLMHMGALIINGEKKQSNFKHIILNNGAHDSVGGQPTPALGIDIPSIAQACGYSFVQSVEKKQDLEEKVERFLLSEGPSLLEIKVKKGARPNLGRPTTTTVENKNNFMRFLKE